MPDTLSSLPVEYLFTIHAAVAAPVPIPGGPTGTRVIVNVTGGEIVTQILEQIWGTDVWRLVVDVVPSEKDTVELNAHIAGFDRKLSETWLYQWIKR